MIGVGYMVSERGIVWMDSKSRFLTMWDLATGTTTAQIDYSQHVGPDQSPDQLRFLQQRRFLHLELCGLQPRGMLLDLRSGRLTAAVADPIDFHILAEEGLVAAVAMRNDETFVGMKLHVFDVEDSGTAGAVQVFSLPLCGTTRKTRNIAPSVDGCIVYSKESGRVRQFRVGL